MRFLLPILILALSADIPAAARTDSGPEVKAESPAARNEQLDRLYERLAQTSDEAEGRGILRQMERVRMLSGSPTVDLLMDRTGRLIGDRDLPQASEMAERILALAPQWPEAWYRRALLFQMSGDTERSAIALLKALALDPRHIPALRMLGRLYSNDGDEKNALYIYRQLLALYPSAHDLRETVRRLSLEVEGSEL